MRSVVTVVDSPQDEDEAGRVRFDFGDESVYVAALEGSLPTPLLPLADSEGDQHANDDRDELSHNAADVHSLTGASIRQRSGSPKLWFVPSNGLGILLAGTFR